MLPAQRYVSPELTHFVGRSLPEEEQYSLVLEILKTGWLTHPPHDPYISGNLTITPGARISDNKMFIPEVVCFCDIPVQELDIHVRKYSRFGLAFLKCHHPLAGQLLGFGDLGGCHRLGNDVAVFESGFGSLGCRNVEPFVSLNQILRNALPNSVHGTQPHLGIFVTLLSS